MNRRRRLVSCCTVHVTDCAQVNPADFEVDVALVFNVIDRLFDVLN